MDHDLVLTGPYPYFSCVGGIFFAECTCGLWSADKDSERNLRKRHAEHDKAMMENESQRVSGRSAEM